MPLKMTPDVLVKVPLTPNTYRLIVEDARRENDRVVFAHIAPLGNDISIGSSIRGRCTIELADDALPVAHVILVHEVAHDRYVLQYTEEMPVALELNGRLVSGLELVDQGEAKKRCGIICLPLPARVAGRLVIGYYSIKFEIFYSPSAVADARRIDGAALLAAEDEILSQSPLASL